MYQRGRTSWLKHLDFMLLDISSLFLSFAVAFVIRFPGQGNPFLDIQYRRIFAILILVSIVASLALNNLNYVLRRGLMQELNAVLLLAFGTLALVTIYMFSVQTGEIYSRLLIYYTLLIFTAVDYIVRVTWKKYVLWRKSKLKKTPGVAARSLLILTDLKNAATIVADIESDILATFNVRGIALMEPVGDVREILGVPVVADVTGAADYICREWIDEVLVYLPDQSTQPKDFLNACAEMGVTIHTVLNIRSVERNKQFIESVGYHTVLTTAFNYITATQALIKRAMDVVGGIVGSVLAILIGIVVGPIIYINSPGPIIFKQKRIGRNGKPFYVLKYRSMYLDAEERKKEFITENRISDGMMFKLDFDPRIIGNKEVNGVRKTGIGEFIRKTSLDEFPQFFNVLKGEMSLVGTRPPTIDEWEKYQYHHRARLAVKPGITGLWQVSGRSEITDFEKVVKLDTDYICRFKISLDIKILLKTVVVLLQRKGAL